MKVIVSFDAYIDFLHRFFKIIEILVQTGPMYKKEEDFSLSDCEAKKELDS